MRCYRTYARADDRMLGRWFGLRPYERARQPVVSDRKSYSWPVLATEDSWNNIQGAFHKLDAVAISYLLSKHDDGKQKRHGV